MSDRPLDLPARPSLENLRKQAKDRLDAMPGAKLADAQFAVARDYGFESWPRLARHVQALAHPEVEQQERIARDMVAAYRERDSDAARRLNDLFHSAIDVDQIRAFITTRLLPLPGGAERLANFGVADARLLVAGLYGFDDWDTLVSQVLGATDAAGAPGLSSAPPFFRIDEESGVISPQQPMSARDWERLIAVMKERGVTGLNANNMLDDAAMGLLAGLEQLTVLKLHGSNRVTDAGLRHLASLPALEELEVGGGDSPITDAGLEVLRTLPRLRAFRSWWSRRLSDAGVANLQACEQLEEVVLLGATTGDGVVRALAGKKRLRHFVTGREVTDAGLPLLHGYPVFKTWHGGEAAYGLMSAEAGPNQLTLDGPFTNQGFQSLEGLDGVFALTMFWHVSRLGSDALAILATLPRLGMLGCQDQLCDDVAMQHIGALPHLRMLMAQGAVATDRGFAALGRSQTLEYVWGRDAPNFGSEGFVALAAMPSLLGIAISCKNVSDAALARLPSFPRLRALMPMDVTDEGFRHVGRCERLEELWCMYCRETGDVATEHISALRLKTYYAGLTKITDRSLKILARMASLERVHFHECHGITDAGLSLLKGLPNLRELAVEGCRNVTRSGMSGFHRGVRVTYSTI